MPDLGDDEELQAIQKVKRIYLAGQIANGLLSGQQFGFDGTAIIARVVDLTDLLMKELGE